MYELETSGIVVQTGIHGSDTYVQVTVEKKPLTVFVRWFFYWLVLMTWKSSSYLANIAQTTDFVIQDDSHCLEL